MVSPAAMIFCRGEQRSPVDLTLLRHTGATFGHLLVFCPFFIALPLNNLYTMYLHKNAVLKISERRSGLFFCVCVHFYLLCFRLVERQFYCYGRAFFQSAFKLYFAAVICDYMLDDGKSQTCSAYLL